MNWKNRLTNYNFWISLVSAVLLIFQAFNIKFDIVYINEIATAVLGLLVVVGIISDPTRVSVKEVPKTETKKEKTTEEPLKEIEEEIVSVKEETVEQTNEAKEESCEMPVEVKNENNFNFNQDDFKVLIEKISADLHNLTMKKEEVAKKEETEEITTTQAEVQTYNIVN